jgi:hypothetical protein
MAGRPHQREGARARRTVEHVVHGHHSGPGRKTRDIVRLRRRVGVRIERNGASSHLTDQRQVIAVMYPGELLIRCDPRFDDLAAALPKLRRNHLHDLCAFDALGVTRRRQVIGEAIGGDERERHGEIVQNLPEPDVRGSSFSLPSSCSEFSSAIEQCQRARFERAQLCLELLAHAFELIVGNVAGHFDRSTDRQRHRAERLGDLCPIPTPHRPVAAGFKMKRQQRIACRPRKPHSTWLSDTRRPARPVEGEPGGLPLLHVAHELQHRLTCAT